MKPITIPAVLALLVLGTGSEAGEALALRGLFCKSENQILEVQQHMRSGLPSRIVAGMMNRDEVACVYADRIQYVVEAPAIIDQIRDGSSPVRAYQATLTGVRVGENLRPIEPPLPIFFVTPDPVEGAVFLGRA